MSSQPKEVFLSHSSHNLDFTVRLANVLTGHGIPTWYSERNILGAQQWHDEIGRALVRCDWFALILSPAAVESPWVKRELLYALNDRGYQGRILPLLYQDCELIQLSWTLTCTFQIIDFRSDYDAACRELLRTWGVGYAG